MKSVITGSIAFDYLMSFPGLFSDHLLADKLDCISVSFLVDKLNRRRGGCAPNIAYSLALLGENPLLVGAAGDDFGSYGEALKAAGVDTAGVLVKSEVLTASFFANTDEKGNQICSFYTGAMQFAREIALRELVGEQEAMVIISPNDPEAMSRHAKDARDGGYKFIYDPSQQIVRLDGETLKADASGAWILILNEYEEEMFLKKTGLERPDLLQLAENVIVTLADKGAEIRTAKETFAVPAGKPSQILDPTGVGDAFRSGLLKGLASGLTWDIAGRMGSLAAAYVLETDGPQSHKYTIKEFCDRYTETFGEERQIQKLLA